MRITRFIWFIIMLTIGAALGLYYTWVINPVEFVDAAFPHLRQDYKADYVLMAAEIYAEDHVLYKAMIRLDMLMEPSVAEAVNNAINTAQGFAYSDVDMEKLYALQAAVSGGHVTPTPIIDQTLQADLLLTQHPPQATEEAVPEQATLLPTLEGNPFEGNEFPANTNVPQQSFQNESYVVNEAPFSPEMTETPLPQMDMPILDQSADDFLNFSDTTSDSEDYFIRTGDN